MMEILILLVALAVAALSGWIYWQMQQRQQRMQEQEEDLRRKTILITDLADEMSMASHYLYETMDQCLARMEQMDATVQSVPPSLHQCRTSATTAAVEPSPAHTAIHDVEAVLEPALVQAPPVQPEVDQDRPAQSSPTSVQDEEAGDTDANTYAIDERTAEKRADAHRTQEERSYHPHLRALALAAQQMEPVDIARHTGVGVEELRLLLRFQDELFGAASADAR